MGQRSKQLAAWRMRARALNRANGSCQLRFMDLPRLCSQANSWLSNPRTIAIGGRPGKKSMRARGSEALTWPTPRLFTERNWVSFPACSMREEKSYARQARNGNFISMRHKRRCLALEFDHFPSFRRVGKASPRRQCLVLALVSLVHDF